MKTIMGKRVEKSKIKFHVLSQNFLEIIEKNILYENKDFHHLF